MPQLRHSSTPKTKRQRKLSISSLLSVAALVVTLLLFHPTLADTAPSEATEAAFFAAAPPIIGSHLYEIQLDAVEFDPFSTWGGAIEPL